MIEGSVRRGRIVKTNGFDSLEGLKNWLASLFHEIGGVPLEEIHDDATIDGALNVTSVTFVEIQVAIEDALDLLLDPIVIVELNRFGDIVDYIFRLAQDKPA